MNNTTPVTSSYLVALIEDRRAHKPGDYIEPLVNGHRVTLRVLEKHERGVTFMGFEDVVTRFICVDRHGNTHNVGISDDPRDADEDEIARFTDSERRQTSHAE